MSDNLPIDGIVGLAPLSATDRCLSILCYLPGTSNGLYVSFRYSFNYTMPHSEVFVGGRNSSDYTGDFWLYEKQGD